MSVIKELFYGNINPIDQSFFPSTKKLGEVQKSLWSHQATLYAALNEQEKELFDKFDEANVNLTQISNTENFANGFSLGLRIAFESIRQL